MTSANRPAPLAAYQSLANRLTEEYADRLPVADIVRALAAVVRDSAYLDVDEDGGRLVERLVRVELDRLVEIGAQQTPPERAPLIPPPPGQRRASNSGRRSALPNG